LNELVVQRRQTSVAPNFGEQEELVVRSSQPVAQPAQQEVDRPKITADDLQSRHMPEIRDFLRVMRGTVEDDLSDEEAVNRYLDINRFFAGGNAVSAVRNLSTINSLSDEDKVLAGRGFDLFNSMENIFSEENTWSETGEGVKDYAAAVLADPVNLISLGIGKVVAAGGVRAGTRAAQQEAMRAYRASLASVATREAAEKAGREVVQKSMEQAGQREIARSTAVQTSRPVRNRLEAQGILAATGFDTVVAVGVDQAYQAGLIRTGAQEDMSWAQTGLAALGVLTIGGTAAALSSRRGSSGLTNYTEGPVTQPNTQNVSAALNQTVVTMGDWAKKVAGGKPLSSLDNEFWDRIVLGDSSIGLKGLAENFVDLGFAYKPRDESDTITNWFTDVLKQNLSNKDALQFLRDFRAATGITGLPVSRKSYNTLAETMAYTIARSASEAGQTLNRSSKLKALFSGNAAPTTQQLKKTTAGRLLAGETTGSKLMDGFRRFQNNTIRMIVTNPATTMLNVQGWVAASTLNSAVDVTRGALYGGKAGLQMLTGVGDFKETWKLANANWATQIQKLRNTIDPNTTEEVFRSYLLQRPEQLRELAEVGAGGIDIQNQVGRGPFDPTIGRVGVATEKFIDNAQRLNLVQAQDAFTKSQEFLYQLERRVREKYGKSLAEFFKDPNRRALMASEDYARIETEAVKETLRSIFSKSFKDRTTLGEAAGIIEDMRNIPIIGLLVPFGRFFNNTVAFMGDATGMSILGKYFGGTSQYRSYGDLFTRAAVSFGFVAYLVGQEMEYIEKGLGTFQEVEGWSGDIVDKKFEFPYSLYKAAARIVAYTQLGKDLPQEEADSMQEAVTEFRRLNESVQRGEPIPQGVLTETFEAVGGQLFRQLFGAGDGIAAFIEETLSGEKSGAELLASAATAPVSQVASGWTRFLEPYNTVLALARDTDWQVMDRRQGSELITKSLRYMDQMVDALVGFENVSGSQPQQLQSAAGGAARVDMGKFAGMRQGQNMTYTERVVNRLGIPAWQLNSRSILPEGDNRFNQLFNSIIEKEAKKLWEDERFKRDPQFRERRWADVVERARTSVRGLMESGITDSGDRNLQAILRLSTGHGERKINQALRELGFDGTDLSDLTFGQLQLLDTHLKTRDDMIRYQR
jgi:hypothetical protein